MLPQFTQTMGGQRRPEFLTWVGLCIAIGAKSYVELGTGHSGYVAKAGIPSVVAVDLTNVDDQTVEGVHYFRGDSHSDRTVERVLRFLGCNPDVVFIDADHNGDAPRKDFDMWWPLAQKLVAFHDILIPNIENNIWPGISIGIPSAKIIACDAASAIEWQGSTAPKDGVLSGGGIGVLFK